MLKRVALVAALLLPAAAALAQGGAPAGVPPGPGAVRTAPFDLQAHRGGRGLAPENTLAAFRRALAIGVTTLETDVAVTRDGVPVLAHDPRLNPDIVRGPDGGWLRGTGPAIRSLMLQELQRYDVGRLDPQTRYARQWPQQQPADGETFPTLASLFALAGAHVAAGGRPPRFNLETKLTPDSGDDTLPPAEYARVLVDAVRSAGLTDRVTIQSFDWRTLVEVRRIAPEIPTACLTIESEGMNTVRSGADGISPWHAGIGGERLPSLPMRIRDAGCSIWSMFWRNLTVSSAQEARALGLKLLPWTVNDPAEMGRLIDLGVDGLITDYPDRLRRVLVERGIPAPERP